MTHDWALQFGLKIQKIIKDEHLRPVGIRVTYKGLLVFQYLMDGKKEDQWLKRKERTVLESGKSSYEVFLNQEQYHTWINNDQYAICGGGYPIIENGQCVGSICVSGLAHDEDHRLIVRVLKEMDALL